MQIYFEFNQHTKPSCNLKSHTLNIKVNFYFEKQTRMSELIHILIEEASDLLIREIVILYLSICYL